MNDTKKMLAIEMKPDRPNDPYIVGTDIRLNDIVNYILEGYTNTKIELLQPGITNEQTDLVREAMDKGGATPERVSSMVPRIGADLTVGYIDEDGNET